MEENNYNKIFSENPKLMIKFIRQFAENGKPLSKEEWIGIVSSAHTIRNEKNMSEVGSEISRILMTDKPSFGIRKLYQSGILFHIIPQLANLANIYDHKSSVNLFEHTLLTIDNSDKNEKIRWACLLHDVGKSSYEDKQNEKLQYKDHERLSGLQCISILKALDMPTANIRDIVRIVKHHGYFDVFKGKKPSTKSIKKFLKEFNDDEVKNILCVIEADNKSHASNYNGGVNIDKIKKIISDIKESEKSLKEKNKLPLNGEDIIERLKLTSGPLIGRFMSLVRTWVNETPNITKEECLNKLSMQYNGSFAQ